MTILLNHIIEERKGCYCHALELDNVYGFECVIEQIVSDYKNIFTLNEIIEFFDSIELYYLPDDTLTSEHNDAQEEEIYNYDYITCIKDCYH